MSNEQKKEMALSPYRILDLTEGTILIGAKLLADLGADVIKIEKPGGSPSRVGPFYKDIPDPEKSLLWFAYNTNKRSITLDIETKDGQELFKKLVKTADVVMECFEPGYMADLGLDYNALCEIKPDIIMTSISLFGQNGPKAHYKGCDLTAWASGGMVWMSGEAGRPPLQVSFPQAFLHGGAEGASGTVAALYHRAMTGEGQFVDVSIQECVIRTLNNTPPMWELNQFNPSRCGMSLVVPPHNLILRNDFKAKDGYILMFVMGGAGGGFADSSRNLVAWMDEDCMAPDWLKNLEWVNEFDASKPIQALADRVHDAVEAFTMTKSKMGFFDEAMKRRILAAPVSNVKDIREFPQLESRDFWTKVTHPELGDTLTYIGPPIKMSETPLEVRQRAPLIGEHNDEVYLSELGISPEVFVYLKQHKII